MLSVISCECRLSRVLSVVMLIVVRLSVVAPYRRLVKLSLSPFLTKRVCPQDDNQERIAIKARLGPLPPSLVYDPGACTVKRFTTVINAQAVQ
jgi:hypothetical protein